MSYGLYRTSRPYWPILADGKVVDIDAAIARARRQVELMQEYRARLIADVVTGKLDVREAAADGDNMYAKTIEGKAAV